MRASRAFPGQFCASNRCPVLHPIDAARRGSMEWPEVEIESKDDGERELIPMIL
jgi:hypothetical protein